MCDSYSFVTVTGNYLDTVTAVTASAVVNGTDGQPVLLFNVSCSNIVIALLPAYYTPYYNLTCQLPLLPSFVSFAGSRYPFANISLTLVSPFGIRTRGYLFKQSATATVSSAASINPLASVAAMLLLLLHLAALAL